MDTITSTISAFGKRIGADQPWRTLPNYITLTRLALLPALIPLLMARLFVAALILTIVAFLSDFLDGYIARRTGTVTPLGTWLDPVADRIAGVAVMAGLAAGHAIPWAFVVCALIPDAILFVTSVVRFGGDPRIPVTRMGKVRTAALFSGLIIVLGGMALAELGAAIDLVQLAVGGGFALCLLGLVGHWIAGVQYLRAMWTTPRRTVPTGA